MAQKFAVEQKMDKADGVMLKCTFGHMWRVMAMGQVGTVDVRAQFSEIINRAAFAKERVTLTRRGKEIVAVVPIEDVKLLEAWEDKIDLEEAREALSEAKKKAPNHGIRSRKSWASDWHYA
jgi:prevent-host-death family protein